MKAGAPAKSKGINMRALPKAIFLTSLLALLQGCIVVKPEVIKLHNGGVGAGGNSAIAQIITKSFARAEDHVSANISAVDGMAIYDDRPIRKPKIVEVTPGDHEFEMEWETDNPEIIPSSANHSFLYMGGLGSASYYRSVETYRITATIKPNKYYFIDVFSKSTRSAEGEPLPNKLCLAETELGDPAMKMPFEGTNEWNRNHVRPK